MLIPSFRRAGRPTGRAGEVSGEGTWCGWGQHWGGSIKQLMKMMG